MANGLRWVTAHAAAQFEAVSLLARKPTNKVMQVEIKVPFQAQQVRLVLCERYGDKPVIYRRALLCRGDKAWSVTFNGDAAAVLVPGHECVSDPISVTVNKGDTFTLWLFHSQHMPRSFTVVPASYSKPNELYDTKEPPFKEIPFKKLAILQGACCYARIEAETADENACAIAAFGDSITAMGMWTEPFCNMLYEKNGPVLLNMGISGNRLLRDTHMPFLKKTQFFGLAGLTRFTWDVANLHGVRTVMIALGINDIAQPGGNYYGSPHRSERCSVDSLIEGYKKLIAMCKEKNLKTVGCTITPFGGYHTHGEVTERIRKDVNDWILTSGAFDMTVDFASAVQDEENPEKLMRECDSGDRIHPSDFGGIRMAECIDIDALIALTKV